MTAAIDRRALAGRWLAAVTLAGALAACGGGDGSSAGAPTTQAFSYTGSTRAATLSDSNAASLAGAARASAVAGIEVTGALTAIQIAEVPVARDAHHTTARVVERIVTHTATRSGSAGLVAGIGTGSEIIAGSCGGTANVVIRSANSATIIGSVRFNHFCEPEVVFVSGSVDFTANITLTGDPVNPVLVLSLAITTASGERLSVYARHAGTVYWIDALDLAITTVRSAYSEVTLSGNFFHPVHGYVTVSTPATLRVLASDHYPSSGSLLLTDTGNRRALLSALDATRYQLQIDADADGAYETTTTGPWPGL